MEFLPRVKTSRKGLDIAMSKVSFTRVNRAACRAKRFASMSIMRGRLRSLFGNYSPSAINHIGTRQLPANGATMNHDYE